MISEEERKAIEYLKTHQYVNSIYKEDNIQVVLNLIKTQNKMINLMAEYIDGSQIECNVYYKNKYEVIEQFRTKAKESE